MEQWRIRPALSLHRSGTIFATRGIVIAPSSRAERRKSLAWLGRYIIARAYLGAPDHRLWLNGAPTEYRGTIEFLKRTVDEIIFGLAKPPDVEEQQL